jgi:hypothetical protein
MSRLVAMGRRMKISETFTDLADPTRLRSDRSDRASAWQAHLTHLTHPTHPTHPTHLTHLTHPTQRMPIRSRR